MKDLHVIEYSFDQGCYHVDTLASAVATNLRMLTEGRPSQYVIIGVFESSDASCEWLDRVAGKAIPGDEDDPRTFKPTMTLPDPSF